MRVRMLLACVLFCLAGCSSRKEEVEIGYLGKARSNAFLAAERLLGEWGWDVVKKSNLNEMPDYNDTILIARESIKSEAIVLRLLDWVTEGGHLIYVSENGGRRGGEWQELEEAIRGKVEDEDLFLKPLGVELLVSEQSGPVTVLMGENCNVDFGGERGFRVEDLMKVDVRAADSVGKELEVSPVVSFRKVQGRVTLIADASPWRNRQIDQEDHAQFLVSIGDLLPDGASFWFVSGTDVSFFGMLWKYGWMPLVSLFVLVGLWLWKNLPRFGPMRADVEASSLRFADHLKMSGHFFWRRRNVEQLLAPMRRRVLSRVVRVRGLVHTKVDEEESFDWLAKHSGMDPERLSYVMNAKNIKDGAQLTRLVRDLQNLETTL
jgi:hypothetical protein